MRLGTTLCLHLNNPRARGYAYPRDFVLPLPSTHTHPCIVSVCLAYATPARLFPRGNGKRSFHSIHLQRVCVYIYMGKRVNRGEGEFSPLFRSGEKYSRLYFFSVEK